MSKDHAWTESKKNDITHGVHIRKHNGVIIFFYNNNKNNILPRVVEDADRIT